nr:putative Ulp1 protease family catalytic domain-containing protein [Ipomoea batatas]
MLDLLGPRLRNDDWKHVVDMAMKMFHAVGNGKKGRSKTSWEIVKAPRQPDNNQCGFYVMAYMRTLIEHMPDIDDKESVQALITALIANTSPFPIANRDVARMEWVEDRFGNFTVKSCYRSLIGCPLLYNVGIYPPFQISILGVPSQLVNGSPAI